MGLHTYWHDSKPIAHSVIKYTAHGGHVLDHSMIWLATFQILWGIIIISMLSDPSSLLRRGWYPMQTTFYEPLLHHIELTSCTWHLTMVCIQGKKFGVNIIIASSCMIILLSHQIRKHSQYSCDTSRDKRDINCTCNTLKSAWCGVFIGLVHVHLLYLILLLLSLQGS